MAWLSLEVDESSGLSSGFLPQENVLFLPSAGAHSVVPDHALALSTVNTGNTPEVFILALVEIEQALVLGVPKGISASGLCVNRKLLHVGALREGFLLLIGHLAITTGDISCQAMPSPFFAQAADWAKGPT